MGLSLLGLHKGSGGGSLLQLPLPAQTIWDSRDRYIVQISKPGASKSLSAALVKHSPQPMGLLAHPATPSPTVIPRVPSWDESTRRARWDGTQTQWAWQLCWHQGLRTTHLPRLMDSAAAPAVGSVGATKQVAFFLGSLGTCQTHPAPVFGTDWPQGPASFSVWPQASTQG